MRHKPVPVVDMETGEKPAEIGPDRRHGDLQVTGNLLVGVTGQNVLYHFCLSGR